MFVTVLGLVLVLSPLFSTSNGTPPCEDGEFPCNDGKCIDAYHWCDFNKDCSDGSDEAYCRKNTLSDKRREAFCRKRRCNRISKACLNESQALGCLYEVSFRKRNTEFLSIAMAAYDLYVSMFSLKCSLVAGPSEELSENPSPIQISSAEADYSPSDEFGDFNSEFDPKIDAHPVDHFDDAANVFSELHPSQFSLQREKARRWIVSQRLDNFGWGSETPRALTALYLSDVHRSKRNETDMLMVKQLEVQLSLDIARNGTKAMALTDLALYINALMASCRDPRNFYGNDLVGTLRNSVNYAQNVGKFVNPAVYLTLCLNNFIAHEDVRRLHEILYSRNAALGRIDIQAISMLTATCAFRSNKSVTAETYEGFKQQFITKLKSKNFTGNIYEAALVLQALNEAKLDGMEWKRSDLKKFLLTQQHEDGSFGCFTPIEVLKNTKRRKIPVQYSLNFGDPVEVTQILQIQVAEETNFLDIMRLAQEINPMYRFLLDDMQEIPVVYSIGDIPNDAEKGMFWMLHVASANNRPRSDVGRLVPYLGNVATPRFSFPSICLNPLGWILLAPSIPDREEHGQAQSNLKFD
ncbi:uncharacterized protein TNCV_1963891 [Trichonephila clavipes]|nr:uncharacterized protein TNCV_1963891 [Trichonephila clavipes]